MVGIDRAVRIDRWLVAARAWKSRGDAQEACVGGKVKINGAAVKPSHLVKRGDEVGAESPRGTLVWVVRELAEKRLSGAQAQLLYDDHSPPPPPPEERVVVAVRERGAGRPTKADRRATDRFRSDE
jgi:ribosome-associated heat shock protein Hsp15